MKPNAREIMKDHERLLGNLKLIQKTVPVSELSELLMISKNTWTNRMKEPWKKFSYDDFKAICRYCNIDFTAFMTDTLKVK